MRQRRSVLVGMLLEDLLVNIQHFAVGAVADGVNAELKVVLDGQFADPLELGDVAHRQPDAIRLIGVRLQQPRSARAQRAIHISLDGPHRKVIVARADDAIAVQIGGQLCGCAAAQHDPQPQAAIHAVRPCS